MSGIDIKIIYVFEKLVNLYRSLLWDASKDTDISPLGIQVILFISENQRERRLPSIISEELGIKRATLSDSLKVLIEKNILIEEKNLNDRRYKFLSLTDKGRALLKKILLNYRKEISKSLKSLTREEKIEIFRILLKIIAELQDKNIIKVSPMCINCKNFIKDAHPDSEKKHLCKLTGRRMKDYEIKVRCNRSEVSFKL
ncbi:MAG: MarR family winged helix-turn-helix transcriptional regulator [Candidatus Hydrothermales bacterium]